MSRRLMISFIATLLCQCAYANGSRSVSEGITQIAVFNETNHPIHMLCQFALGMKDKEGGRGPTEYQLSAYGDQTILLYGEPETKGYWLSCFVTDKEAGPSFFAYASRNHFVVNGHFQFDPVYDGAFTYE